MMVSIEAETSLWTAIVIRDANGGIVFDGMLKMEQDWWMLYRQGGTRGYYDDTVGRWSGRRDHLAVLADALKVIAKAASTEE